MPITANALHRATASRIEFEIATIIPIAGLAGLLGYLNSRTRFRYTGVYRFDPPLLHGEALFDRENPDLVVCSNVHALDATYCSIVLKRGSAFETENARVDASLREHPARERVISYVGVPIRLSSGIIWGVLCHHDSRPRMCPPGEREVMEIVAPKLHALLPA